MRRRVPRGAGLARSAWRTRLGFEKVRGGAWLSSSLTPVSSFRSLDEAQRNPGGSGLSAAPDYAALHPGYEIRRKRNAGKRRVPPPHLAMRRALNGARTLDGVPPRLSPKGIIPSQRLSFRPGFLGRGLNGRYPPSPVPVQGCTSHPGRNAGRHDAQAAREQTANPPAGTALAPMTRCASAPCPSRGEDRWGLYAFYRAARRIT